MKLLIAHDARINVVDSSGDSPLSDAVSSRNIEVATILLDQQIVEESKEESNDVITVKLKRML